MEQLLYISDKKEELRKASAAKKRTQLQFLKSQMEKDLQVWSLLCLNTFVGGRVVFSYSAFREMDSPVIFGLLAE